LLASNLISISPLGHRTDEVFMLSRTSFCRLVLVLAFLVLPLGLVRAQRLEDGEVQFMRSRPVKDSRPLRNQLFKGETQADPREKDHIQAVEIAAKEAIYPLVWYSKGRTIERGKINRVVEDFASRLSQMTKFNANTTTMQYLFSKQAIDRIQEVIQSDEGKAISSMNAAVMLSRIVERRMDRGVLQSEKSWADEVGPRLASPRATVSTWPPCCWPCTRTS
jgi:hypothetical protein